MFYLSAYVLATMFICAPAFAERVRVRVARINQPIFSLTGQSLQIAGLPPLKDFAALRIARSGSAGWIITDRDTNKLISRITTPLLSIRGEMIRANLKSVPNQISISSRASGTDIIADLDFEEYLAGVLPAEMPASWPLESLKAQAVAARTYALFRKKQREADKARTFDLESDVSDQMFANPLGANRGLLTNVERALKETRGQTLRDRKGRLFATYFHADCGGRTEEARDVWGVGEKMGTTDDADCPLNPQASWILRVSQRDLGLKFSPAKKVSALSITEKSSSGRAASVQISWMDGTITSSAGNEFRQALGYDRLKSTQFTISRDGLDYVFKGRGFGHGVGMCQWGARHMAKAGRSYLEILKHYYSSAHIEGPESDPLARQNNLDDKEGDRANNKQVAQFH